MRVLLGLIVLLLAGIVAACGTGDSSETQRLRDELAALRAQAEASDAAYTLSPSPTPAIAGPPPVQATRAPASSPTPEATARAASSSTPQFVASTGGSGVALRSECSDDARSGGAWAEGTEVKVEQIGVGACEGWSFASVARDTSWVHDRYLSSTRPTPIPTPRATATPAPPVVRRATPTPTAAPRPAESAPPTSDSLGEDLPAAITVWVTNADLSGFSSTDGRPIVPARGSCGVDGELLGWGLFDGAAIDALVLGANQCEGWVAFYSQEREAAYWVSLLFLSLDKLAEASAPAPALPPPSPSASTIKTCIASDFDGWSGDTVFELCNGQVWIQSSYAYRYHYAYRPDVTIVETRSGYLMFVDGIDDPVSVQRITNFVKTCISGEFEGFDGETVFTLCNGQIWQQAEYRYRYHYAYRPQVLIYQPPAGGFRMKVDGIDDTIRVRRIR